LSSLTENYENLKREGMYAVGEGGGGGGGGGWKGRCVSAGWLEKMLTKM